MQKKLKVMLALGNEALEKAIMSRLGENYLVTTPAVRKGMIRPLIVQEQPDVLIVIEKLIGELNESMYDILYRVRAEHPNIRILLLYTLEEDEIGKVIPYTQIGIYDIWTAKKIQLSDILGLLEHPKNFGDWARILQQGGPAPSISSQPMTKGNTPTQNNEPQTLKVTPPSVGNDDVGHVGRLKLKQDHQELDMHRQRTIPTLVENTGYNMGRVNRSSRPQPKKSVVEMEDNTIIDVVKKDIEVIPARTARPQECVQPVMEGPALRETQQGVYMPEVQPIPDANSLEKFDNEEFSLDTGASVPAKETTVSTPEAPMSRPVPKQEPGMVSTQSAPSILEPVYEGQETRVQRAQQHQAQPTQSSVQPQRKVEQAIDANGKVVTKTALRKPPMVRLRNRGTTAAEEDAKKKDIKQRTIIVPKELKREPVVETKAPEKTVVQKEDTQPRKEQRREERPVRKENKPERTQQAKPKQKQEVKPAPKQEVKKETRPAQKPKVEEVKQQPKAQPKMESAEVKAPAKQKIAGQECRTILFASVDAMSQEHTALNTAILLAKQGNQVVYLDVNEYSASDCFMQKGKEVLLYNRYPVHDCELVHGKVNSLALIKKSDKMNMDRDVFSLIKKIKEVKEADFIIVNAKMTTSIDNLFVICDESYAVMQQSPVQLYMLRNEYAYRFKFMDILLTSYQDNKLLIKDVFEATKCRKVIKIEDSDTMNYNAVTKRTPLALSDNKEKSVAIYQRLLNMVSTQDIKS